jgi:hypothetical protein
MILIECTKLEDYFTALVDSYEHVEEAGQGEALVDLLVRDWVLFGDLENSKIELLLGAILGASYSNDKRYMKQIPNAGILNQWDEFCKEIKNSNRFFPQAIQSFIGEENLLHNMLSILAIDSNEVIEGSRVYRARKNSGSEPLPIDKMGAPPVGLASAGRANPNGISYLYVASTVNTAISELRPHKNEKLTIAELEVVSETPLKLIDLRNPRRTISPFQRLDYIEQLVSDIELLVRLGTDLTQPVLLDDAALEYLPSQYLCEYIKSIGYDGVIYESALGNGFNFAIFNASNVRAISTSDHVVDEVSISHTLVLTS